MGIGCSGVQVSGERWDPEGGLFRRSLIALTAALIAVAFSPSPAIAVDHLMKVREVYAGNASAPDAQFVNLQMFANGQNQTTGNRVHIYASDGSVAETVVIPVMVPTGVTQAQVLVATDEAAEFFGVTPDATMAGSSIDPAGGRVCYEDIDNATAGIIDCVSWGTFAAGGQTGNPAFPGTGIRPGNSMERDVTGGTNATRLDAGDDTNDSAADFDRAVLPTPANNSGAVTATGGQASVSAATLAASAATGIQNRLSATPAGGALLVRDDAAPIIAGSGCVQQRVDRVQCDALTVTQVSLDTGDLADTLRAPAGFNSILMAGVGNDSLKGSDGDDDLVGGDGNDALDGAAGSDDLDGGDGTDTARYVTRSAVEPLDIDIDDMADDGGSLDDSGGIADNVHTNVENVLGGAGDDSLTGSEERNSLTGGGGTDDISALGGNDIVRTANDGSADSVLCGLGHDRLLADLADAFPSTGDDACEQIG